MSRKSSAAPESPALRRGPKPLLSVELETQLVQWILTQQSAGRRVSRDDVINQAQEMLRLEESQEGTQKTTQTVGMGWCNRFVARHLELNLRSGVAPIVQTKSTDSNDATRNITIGGGMLPDAAVNGQQVESLKSSESKQENEKVGDAAEPTKTRKYNRKHMEAAVGMYLAGRSMGDVTQRFPLLHQRTIRRRVLRVQRGEVDRRRGPRPLLEGEPEQELVAWILDMQSRGTRVTKKDILARANEQYRELTGETAEDRLKEGWLRRFKERHPVLSGRAPTKVHRKGENNSSVDSDNEFSSGDGEVASTAQSMAEQEKAVPISAVEEKLQPQKCCDVGESGRKDTAASSKRQKTEDFPSTRSPSHSDVACGASILPGRRQAEKAENVQSNNRLEEMQRQQLEMLQQLCASNDVLSCIAGPKRVIKNTSTE
ncbi:hypothetical protein PF008_g22196 [Phytophthora fragariae]|uniref:HTH CENPB-type domain-containing protein n=1 Tax=Phytophthora fragariae TaxID=53985 RepID=A0A6G0QUE9_9STRA|nr:hypothetical protein PF008_g22196 [Phytophthora fragariae]